MTQLCSFFWGKHSQEQKEVKRWTTGEKGGLSRRAILTYSLTFFVLTALYEEYAG